MSVQLSKKLTPAIKEILSPKALTSNGTRQFTDKCYFEMKEATIYTDGACSRNGQSDNARGGIGVHWEGNERNNISEPLPHGRQTNQRAEIIAARRGIDQAREQGYSKVTVKTDSQYVKKAAEIWIPNWRRSNWSKNIVNKEEFQQLDNSIKLFPGEVNFEKVPSKKNAADKLAREGAKRSGR